MQVGRWMTTDVVSVSAQESLEHARQLLRAHRMRHLPVTEGDRLLGIATEQDLRFGEAMASHSGPMVVADVMTASVITVGPEATVEQAAMTMAENKVGGLPVVDSDDRLIGIITESDIINVLLDAMGVDSGAARLEVLLPDRPGALAEVARVLAERGVNILSLICASAEAGTKVLVVRIVADDLESVLNELAQAGIEVNSVEEGRSG
jgi:acetoin utilization protein AcuB